MEVTLLFFEHCPSWQIADARLRELAEELKLTVTRLQVATTEEAAELQFRGSPTILVDGRDVFAEGHEPVGLSCRIYLTPDGFAGSPTLEQLRAALS